MFHVELAPLGGIFGPLKSDIGVSTHQMLQEDQFDRACQVLLAEVLLRGY